MRESRCGRARPPRPRGPCCHMAARGRAAARPRRWSRQRMKTPKAVLPKATTVSKKRTRQSPRGGPPTNHRAKKARQDLFAECALSPRILSQIGELGGSQTRAGWCLADAIRHIASAKNGSLLPLIEKHGLPRFYSESNAQQSTFISLARAIVGQQLAGAAVRKIWGRFEEQFGGASGLLPEAFLKRTSSAAKLEHFRAVVGLSNAKARALVSLAEFYNDGRLSDACLLDPTLSADQLGERLTAVKGIGPWTAQMFLMFTLHEQV